MSKISANEIRLGNVISYSNDEYWIPEIRNKETEVTIDIFCDVEFHPERFNPIPLTEEILLCCGFVKYESYTNIYDRAFGIIAIRFEKSKETGLSIYFWDGDWSSGLEYIKYLHQLQNLYFALTNTELIINPS